MSSLELVDLFQNVSVILVSSFGEFDLFESFDLRFEVIVDGFEVIIENFIVISIEDINKALDIFEVSVSVFSQSVLVVGVIPAS